MLTLWQFLPHFRNDDSVFSAFHTHIHAFWRALPGLEFGTVAVWHSLHLHMGILSCAVEESNLKRKAGE